MQNRPSSLVMMFILADPSGNFGRLVKQSSVNAWGAPAAGNTTGLTTMLSCRPPMDKLTLIAIELENE